MRKIYLILDKPILDDGFYGITTNLEDDDTGEIIKISERRWQIEECFRIMKSDFKARLVYLQNEDRIKAHFLICFISLIIYRLLTEKLGGKYTVNEIVKTLREMEVVDTQYNGYIPAYKRTELTDELHQIFGFRTDYYMYSPSYVSCDSITYYNFFLDLLSLTL